MFSSSREIFAALNDLPVTRSAPMLLGCRIVAPGVEIALVEVEAYGGSEDLGSHACRRETARNRPMFGPAGHSYVYFTYGNHWMLNVTARPDREPAAVLVRAARPLVGLDVMRPRRPRARNDRDLLSGPGKAAAALGLDGSWSALDMLDAASPIRLLPGESVPRIRVGTRIGLAEGRGDGHLWRFVDDAHADWASRPVPPPGSAQDASSAG